MKNVSGSCQSKDKYTCMIVVSQTFLHWGNVFLLHVFIYVAWSIYKSYHSTPTNKGLVISNCLSYSKHKISPKTLIFPSFKLKVIIYCLFSVGFVEIRRCHVFVSSFSPPCGTQGWDSELDTFSISVSYPSIQRSYLTHTHFFLLLRF